MSAYKGDRQKEHVGRTARKQEGSIGIVYDAELKDLKLGERICLLCCSWPLCSFYDKERSYLYIRENSIESNASLKMCCGCYRSHDKTSVQYFDRAPFRNYGYCCANDTSNGCCASSDQPKYEIFEGGCLICCVHCCKKEKAVIMPWETFPFPCCCCVNRVNCCNNCCGCCGPPTGNPKCYSTIFPEPKNAKGFVSASEGVMGWNKSKDAL